jgi:ribonucleoside-diphosphate reductase alpha chain
MSELPTDYQKFIHKSRYARWIDEENRRETWNETVSRFFNFMVDHVKYTTDVDLSKNDTIKQVKQAILELQVMPSMRSLMTAGPALKRENIAGYNCSYIPIDNPKSFDEVLYILMNGTGVGFSVERQYINNLPTIPDQPFEDTEDVISVADSKEGWARSFKDLIGYLYSNRVPKLDFSKIRPAGERLKTFGGRASGPQPLQDLFEFTTGVFKNAQGRKLSSIECHDIVCKTGEVVVVGGVRRSALLSLSNLTDDRMRSAKSGDWWHMYPHRALANNSVAYTETPNPSSFMKEWLALYESKSGERGIFNRVAANAKATSNGRRQEHGDFGTNPCSEIILRPNQFCNLSEVVCRSSDTVKILQRKAELASILGTLQATLTDFKYLRTRWRSNTEEERLLGVSLTGIMDCAVLHRSDSDKTLKLLKDTVIATNKKWADLLGIPQSTATTCVKPSGTVSQLTDSASGIHARHAPYYVRTVRGDVKDSLTQFLMNQNIPNEPDFNNPSNTVVFSFPFKSPDAAICRTDMKALEQLHVWKRFSDHWCEHKPSVTVSVKEHEWVEVGNWCYSNFDSLSGISFLPFSDHSYRQAPYQDSTKQEYKKLCAAMPDAIDWKEFDNYEKEDNTKASQELACSAGVCEVVDI